MDSLIFEIILKMSKDFKSDTFPDKTHALISGKCPKCDQYQGCYSRDGSPQKRECLKCSTEIKLH